MNIACLLLAVLSIWDYPARQPEHDRLYVQFVMAVREGNTTTMEKTCRKGVKLLPEDPTWRYNLACALAYFPKRADEALLELEKAIDLGFRDADHIAKDNDLKRLAKKPRFKELVEYAKEMRHKPLSIGPMASVPALGVFGKPLVVGAHNLTWDFQGGCFVANVKLAAASAPTNNTGDLYFNRDALHSNLKIADFPGLTPVRLDAEGVKRGMHLNMSNMLFPYPVFGNCSRAFVGGPFWRSLPRAIMTRETYLLKTMAKLYLSNQTWVYPSNADTPPVGTNGDLFASITPYWITSAGRSWSDQQFLRAALTASAAFKDDVKSELVKRGLLAPVIQTLMRKSLKAVKTEDDYLTSKAHPSAFPPSGVDVAKLKKAAAQYTVESIAPLAPVSVEMAPVKKRPKFPEITYATAFAWAFVLRAEERVRSFKIKAHGNADCFRFVQTHGEGVKVKIESLSACEAKVTIDKKGMSPTNRVDITVVARNKSTSWGAPTYVSFAVVDAKAPYSDPVLTPGVKIPAPPPQQKAPQVKEKKAPPLKSESKKSAKK